MENGNDPATKQDIQRLEQRIERLEEELKETLRDGQTELLQAFYSYTTLEALTPNSKSPRLLTCCFASA